MRRFILAFSFALVAAGGVAQAQAPKGFDGKQPVEINADSLEVRQEENVAIFTGNVIAVQGTTRLQSDRMIVHYIQRDGAASPASPAASSGGADPMQGAVDRIEVEGNVLLTTPEETASSRSGVYDVSKKQVDLMNDVVLTRGPNVLKGDTLVYDMATGKSVVNSPHHPAPDVAGAPANGRVRALFVPQKSGEAAKKP